MTQEELLQQQVPEILRRFFGNQVVIPQQQAPQEKVGYGSAFLLVRMDIYLPITTSLKMLHVLP